MEKEKIWFNHIDFNLQPKLQKSDFETLEQVLFESLKSKNFNPLMVMFFLLKQSSCQLDEQLVFIRKEILDLGQWHEVLV